MVIISDITFDFRFAIGDEQITQLKHGLKDVENDDQVTIVVERQDAHQTGDLLKILDQNGFTYQTRGGHEDEFMIIAQKKGHA